MEKMVDLLLSRNANPKAVDLACKLPMYYAIRSDNYLVALVIYSLIQSLIKENSTPWAASNHDLQDWKLSFEMRLLLEEAKRIRIMMMMVPISKQKTMWKRKSENMMKDVKEKLNRFKEESYQAKLDQQRRSIKEKREKLIKKFK